MFVSAGKLRISGWMLQVIEMGCLIILLCCKNVVLQGEGDGASASVHTLIIHAQTNPTAPSSFHDAG